MFITAKWPMLVKRTLLAFSVVFFSTGSMAAILFQDDFETGNLSKTQGSARWGETNSGAAPGDSVRVSSQNPRTGTYSLRFTFGAGANGVDSWAEQRFELGGQYQEVWVQYDLYIPANYNHRTQSSSANNKSFVHLWAGGYSGGGFGGGFEIWPDGSGFGRLLYHNFRPDQEHREDTVRRPRGIDPEDRGTWIQITTQMKTATSANNNGEVRVWKRRQGQSTKDLIFERTGLPIYNSGDNYMERGYLLGWANSGFNETTDLYIDNVIFADSPIDMNPLRAPSFTVQ